MSRRLQADMLNGVFSNLRAETMDYEPRAKDRISPHKAAVEIVGIVACVIREDGDPDEAFGVCYGALTKGIKEIIEDYQKKPFDHEQVEAVKE